MKYVYVVTRIMFEVRPGIINVPNLGVHLNLKSAKRHYKAVVSDRIKSNGLPVSGICFGTKMFHNDRFVVLESDHFPKEEVRLEKWRV